MRRRRGSARFRHEAKRRRASLPVALAAALLCAAPPCAAGTNDAAAQRERRAAADRAALEQASSAAAAFGREQEFAAGLERLRAAAGGAKWCDVADGKLSLVTVERWLEWNRPQPGRELPLALDFELPNHPFGAITDLARQLHAHGIEFLFVSFPTRVQLDPALVVPGLETPRAAVAGAAGDGGAPFRGMVATQERFLAALAAEGVEVLDLAPEFAAAYDAGESDPRRRLLYHRYNMHWTPRAIELAAQRTAERVAAMPWFKSGPYQEGRAFTVRRREFAFNAEGNGQAPGAQDEPIAVNAVQPLGQPIQKEAKQRGPIVLLGDSFADFHKDYAASFHDQLFRFTGWPIDVIAPAGGGELQCRVTLKRRGAGLAEKKVVVWLMQEAALTLSKEFRPLAIFD